MGFWVSRTYAVASPRASMMMERTWWPLLPAILLLALFVSCTTEPSEDEALRCLSDNDCPPKCECTGVIEGSFCALADSTPLFEGPQCGGSCTMETTCGLGASCQYERTASGEVLLYSCLPDGTGGTGGTGGIAGTGGAGGEGGSSGDDGSGGTGGGVDPCALDLPDPAGGSGLKVDVYAVLEFTPVGLSFAADGTLFIGTNPPEPTSPVFWVSPDGSTLNQSPEDFADPDALIVDTDGLVADTAGNVLIGGSFDGGNTGQLVEMDREGRSVGDPFLHPCLRNINHLIFDRDDRLIATNYNLVDANVCAVLQDRSVIDLIPNVEGDGPAGLTVQDPNTGDLYVTTEGIVHRYSSDGDPLELNYTTQGSAMAYGPALSPFEGLLIRRSGQLLVRRVPASDTEELLLTGSVGSFYAFDADGKDANLYISDPPGLRVLRVSLESKNLPPTDVGCPNQ